MTAVRDFIYLVLGSGFGIFEFIFVLALSFGGVSGLVVGIWDIVQRQLDRASWYRRMYGSLD